MSLIDSIEHLQQAPLHKRKIVLAITVFIIMLAVIGLWILQLQYTLSTTNPERTSTIMEPLKLIWNSAKESLTANVKSIYEKGK